MASRLSHPWTIPLVNRFVSVVIRWVIRLSIDKRRWSLINWLTALVYLRNRSTLVVYQIRQVIYLLVWALGAWIFRTEGRRRGGDQAPRWTELSGTWTIYWIFISNAYVALKLVFLGYEVKKEHPLMTPLQVQWFIYIEVELNSWINQQTKHYKHYRIISFGA